MTFLLMGRVHIAWVMHGQYMARALIIVRTEGLHQVVARLYLSMASQFAGLMIAFPAGILWQQAAAMCLRGEQR